MVYLVFFISQKADDNVGNEFGAHNVANENVSTVFGIAERVARVFGRVELRGGTRLTLSQTGRIVAGPVFPVPPFRPQLQNIAIEAKDCPRQTHVDNSLLELTKCAGRRGGRGKKSQ